MKKRILAALLSATMILGMLAGCATSGSGDADSGSGESEDGTVTLTFLNKYPEDPYAQYFVDAVAQFMQLLSLKRKIQILRLRWKMFQMRL